MPEYNCWSAPVSRLTGQVTRTGGARSEDARSAGLFSIDGERGGHPGWLLIGQEVVDAEREQLSPRLTAAKATIMPRGVEIAPGS